MAPIKDGGTPPTCTKTNRLGTSLSAPPPYLHAPGGRGTWASHSPLARQICTFGVQGHDRCQGGSVTSPRGPPLPRSEPWRYEREPGTPSRPSVPNGPGIPSGRLDTIRYASKTVGAERRALVYTPPGFSSEQMYPVLYLLHGIGGDEFEWLNQGNPHIILDNLYAENKLKVILVFQKSFMK